MATVGRLTFFHPPRLEGLWVTDGTAGGTRQLADLTPWALTALGGRLLFGERDGGLWRSDGTVAGTSEVRSFDPLLRQAKLVGGDDRAWLAYDDGGAYGYEIWVTDGTDAGTTLVADLTPGPDGTDVRRVVAADDRLFFTVGTVSPRLWVTNGTEPGTELLGSYQRLDHLTAVGRYLLFSADDGVTGREPWISNGTPGGTRRLGDVCSGPCESEPSEFTAAGGRVYFRATDGGWNSELWAVDVPVRDLLRNDDVVELAPMFPRRAQVLPLEAARDAYRASISSSDVVDRVETGGPLAFYALGCTSETLYLWKGSDGAIHAQY